MKYDTYKYSSMENNSCLSSLGELKHSKKKKTGAL